MLGRNSQALASPLPFSPWLGAVLEVCGLHPEVELEPEGAALRLEAPALSQLNSRFSLERKWEKHLHGCHTRCVTLGT